MPAEQQPTPRQGHTPIRMRQVASSDKLRHRGDFCWQVNELQRRTLVLMIPSGDADEVYSRWTINHRNNDGQSWTWDGNLENPTIKPSLHARGIWHGKVTAGFLVEA